MKRILQVLILIFCAHFLTGQTVHKDYVDGRIYVKCSRTLLTAASTADPRNIPLSDLGFMRNLMAKYGISKASRPFYQADDDAVLPYILKLEFSDISRVTGLIEELVAVRGVEYAEKVPLMKTDVLPNDPTFPAQLTQINAANAWGVFNGSSNITLAIVDNAVMWSHQDLVANTYTNTGEIAGNSIDDDGNGYVDDVNGWDVADNDNNAIPTNTNMSHGTHCAGIAAARTDNSIGIASIGWNIKMIPVKTTANGGSITSIDDGYGGILYAARANARVISCSWGGSGFSQSEQNVINYAWAKGSLIVAAAGNNGNTVQNYPGAYANVYCVASVGATDVKSGFSNYGTWVDIAAPGENIYSTLPNASTGTYGNMSGTSMATPLVSGLAALMLSNYANMTQMDVINCISSTAVNIYTIAANNTYSATSQLGAGRIEAFQAMNCASSFFTIAPVANFFATPLNTCPNTAVNFYDSSLYVPTSWSWIFQGGTPATSTSSNPVVQWATPGTYSVSLTVANGNGTNTATKITYITVAGPIALPLVEGFQAATPFLPANWTQNNIMNDAIYWSRANWTGGFGTSTACAVFDNYNIDAIGERDEMRTPKYIFSNVVTARLRFDVAYARYNSFYSDTLEVKLSTDCGLSWSSIYMKGGTQLSTRSDLTANTFTPTNAQWRTDSINISALTAGQGNVMFSFINHGHYGQAIYLDNINLAFPTPTANAVVPLNTCAGTAASYTNTSLGAGSYTWTFPGGSPATSTLSAPNVSFPAGGIYTVTLIGANGTTTASITRTVNIIAAPVISINTPTICSGNSATLTATGASGYTWTNGPVSPSMSATPLSTTVYTVTGTNGTCPAVKNGTIVVDPTPTISVNTPTICSGNNGVITATGAATYSLGGSPLGGASFTAISLFATTVYTLTGATGNCISSKTATIFVNPTPTLSVNSPSICQGGIATLTVSGAVGYVWNTGANTSTLGVSPALTTVYTATGTALNCTASISTAVSVESMPVVSISGNPLTICAGGSALLNASGATNYVWNTGPTTSSIILSPNITTTYSVTGTNTLCSNMAIITVTVIPTPTLNAAVSPSSICSGASATLMASGVYTSYVWTSPPVPISNNVVTPTQPGSFTFSVMGLGNGGCSTSSIVVLTVNSNPFSTLSPVNANCSNSCSGSVNATSTGGPGPYTYSISGSNCTTLPCQNLCAGNYTFTTTNAAGCASTANFIITAPVNNLSTQVSVSNATCATCANGSAQVSVSGGLSPYTYTWLPMGGNQAQSSGLLPGCYTVSITDANGCGTQSTACVAIDTDTGINGITVAGNHLLIYPNPAQQQVTIEYPGAQFDYVLFNNLGQVIQRKQYNENMALLRLDELAKGVYIIEVTSGETRIQKKLLLD